MNRVNYRKLAFGHYKEWLFCGHCGLESKAGQDRPGASGGACPSAAWRPDGA
jgi:hypothetical protein